MGQRANYIIKQGDRLTIHYHHWRANHIAADLFLGEERFLAFVNECRVDETLLDEPWIEGCVIIDVSSKHLYFWAYEFTSKTSVIGYYLSQLKKKWNGWKVEMLTNRMYDAEKILHVDYISKQQPDERDRWTKEDVVNDRIEEWERAVVLIKDSTDLFVTKTANLDLEDIIGFGPDIVPLLKDKQRFDLPSEEDETTDRCIVIDLPGKSIIINESEFGVWEQNRTRWTGFELIMGDFGYLGTLRLSGIDTTGLEMSQSLVNERFNELVRPVDTFNPLDIAKKLMQEEKNVQFHPDFFANAKPGRTAFERVKAGIRKLFGQR